MATEKQLIDANALYDEMERIYHEHYFDSSYKFIHDIFSAFLRRIRTAKRVDAVEVVHGRWLYDIGSEKYFCSACDEYALSFKKDSLYGDELYEVCLTDYCPNCGADMRGSEE